MPTRWRVERLLLKYNVFGLERTSKFILRVLNQNRRRDNIAKFFFIIKSIQIAQFRISSTCEQRNTMYMSSCDYTIFFFTKFSMHTKHKWRTAKLNVEHVSRSW